MSGIALWALLCVAAFLWLVVLLRRDRLSLGLPVAYLNILLLIHLPGALTRLMTTKFDYNTDVIELGIRYTAIGVLCFVGGVQVARFLNQRGKPVYQYSDQHEFWYFCLIGGLVVQFGLGFIYDLPSLRAAVDRGSIVWALGALLGLRYALNQGRARAIIFWGAATSIYPTLVLLLAGFLSYGSTAMLIVVSALIVSARSAIKVLIVGLVTVYIGLTVYVNYFAHRTEFRETAWSGASFGDRVDAAANMFSDFKWFDPTDDTQLYAIDLRLNQNYFVGLAAMRIQQEQVDYLYGKTIWDGVLALVPRVLWPEKSVYGGSGTIVADMTGLHLDENTSWGVGNVMEFQINFGMPGVVIGFFVLGFAIGWLDFKAAVADARGDQGKLILFFLMAVALAQPGGSIVELSGGAAAAAVTGLIWKWLWQLWLSRSRHRAASREFAAYR